MDEPIQSPATEPQPQTPPAANEDAKQFSQWMAEYGRPALIGLAVAVVLLLGISIWRTQKESKAEAAVQALFQGRSPEEFQQLASADPEAPTAPMALATAAAEFYAQNRYDEALAAYQSFLSQYPGHMLVPDAQIGVAASLEAQDDFAAAAEAYETFAAANANSSLRPQAVMGAARCREQLGDFDAARALYEDFIAANPDSTWLPQAESGLLFLKKAERAKNLPAPAAPVAVEVVPAEAAPEAAPAAVEAAPAAAEESVAPVAAEAVAEAAAPAAEEDRAAQDESKPKKKKSSKKKSGNADAGESAPE